MCESLPQSSVLRVELWLFLCLLPSVSLYCLALVPRVPISQGLTFTPACYWNPHSLLSYIVKISSGTMIQFYLVLHYFVFQFVQLIFSCRPLKGISQPQHLLK